MELTLQKNQLNFLSKKINPVLWSLEFNNDLEAIFITGYNLTNTVEFTLIGENLSNDLCLNEKFKNFNLSLIIESKEKYKLIPKNEMDEVNLQILVGSKIIFDKTGDITKAQEIAKDRFLPPLTTVSPINNKILNKINAFN